MVQYAKSEHVHRQMVGTPPKADGEGPGPMELGNMAEQIRNLGIPEDEVSMFLNFIKGNGKSKVGKPPRYGAYVPNWGGKGDKDTRGKDGKRKGKDGKGKGKPFLGECWICGQTGHRQSDCPSTAAPQLRSVEPEVAPAPAPSDTVPSTAAPAEEEQQYNYVWDPNEDTWYMGHHRLQCMIPEGIPQPIGTSNRFSVLVDDDWPDLPSRVTHDNRTGSSGGSSAQCQNNSLQSGGSSILQNSFSCVVGVADKSVGVVGVGVGDPGLGIRLPPTLTGSPTSLGPTKLDLEPNSPLDSPAGAKKAMKCMNDDDRVPPHADWRQNQSWQFLQGTRTSETAMISQPAEYKVPLIPGLALGTPGCCHCCGDDCAQTYCGVDGVVSTGSDQDFSQYRYDIATSATIGSDQVNSVRVENNTKYRDDNSWTSSIATSATIGSDQVNSVRVENNTEYRDGNSWISSSPSHGLASVLCGSFGGNARTRRRRRAQAARLPQSDLTPARASIEEQKPAELSPSDLLVLLSDWKDTSIPLANLDAPRPGFQIVEAVFDTGAFKSCTPPNLFPGKVRASKMSKAGKGFAGPDKSPIPNLGEQDCEFLIEDGSQAGMILQVAPIDRILIAGADVSRKGDTKVELLKEGGSIINMRTNKMIPLHRRGNADGGVYTMRL